MVPATSSISLTLENMYTETTLSPLPTDATADAFYINGQLQNEAEHAKMSNIIDRYRPEGEGFVRIETQNNMPTAAGLSSSSSGLSALVKACNAYSSLDWIEVSWHRRPSMPQGRPLGVFTDH